MSFIFEMPEIGEGVIEGEVVAWKVAVGDTVAEDQPLCEVMTDKANVEISSPRAGTIAKLFGEPGDFIKVHTPLVEFGEGGAAPAPKAEATPAPAAAPAPKAAAPAPAPKAAPAPAPQVAGPASDPTTRGATKAAPAVRRNAREHGIDIHDVPGTGKGGRITHADVAAYASGAPEPAVMPVAPVALPQVMPSGSEERIKLIGLRRKIAEQMTRSKQTAAHFTYVEQIDASKLVAFRKSLKGMAEKRGVKLTYLPFIMKACSIAFRDFPNMNAVMDEAKQELVVKGDHHMGIACDTPNGLMVPVIKNVEQKSILHIAAEMRPLVDRARTGKAKLDELTGSTFTCTSVGNRGVLATPVINVPEVAILGINAIREQAVVVNGKVEVRPMFYVSPSFDHRVIDGAVAANFVDRLKELLEDPESMLMELS
ncbi:MAG: 2-oxo acid dehydrogenase subunit E2 [Deltaproteobacteria bacterium]|nr:MAG: 2-oxo acid dehydrogenase subunit E2 [Deltaproteobacteria bacterium]